MIYMECKECYSTYRRITPLLKPEECLKQHTQYICGTCGRCICIEKDKQRGLQRWNFPFQSLEKAILYLRTADVTTKCCCGIYELQDASGRLSYKIFKDEKELASYLKKHQTKHCLTKKPLYQRSQYEEFEETQIRILTLEEQREYRKQQIEEKKLRKR